jgi:hypothetical protein
MTFDERPLVDVLEHALDRPWITGREHKFNDPDISVVCLRQDDLKTKHNLGHWKYSNIPAIRHLMVR